jgi:hypothetical protein
VSIFFSPGTTPLYEGRTLLRHEGGNAGKYFDPTNSDGLDAVNVLCDQLLGVQA